MCYLIWIQNMDVPMLERVHTNWRKRRKNKNDGKDFYHHLGDHEAGKKDFIKTTGEEFEKLIEGLIEEIEQQ